MSGWLRRIEPDPRKVARLCKQCGGVKLRAHPDGLCWGCAMKKGILPGEPKKTS